MCFEYVQGFHDKLGEMEGHLLVLGAAFGELKVCRGLHRLFEVLLSIGNYCNHGSSMGNASGFRLEALGQAARMSLSNVLIQSYVDDEFRGRVMSIYMLEMSILSISIFPISVMADIVGPQWAVGGSAACLIVLVLILFAVPAYRDLD